MKRMGNVTFADWDPTFTPQATAVYRVIGGASQIVFVCEGCEDIHTVTVGEAMRSALSAYAKFHHEDRHPNE